LLRVVVSIGSNDAVLDARRNAQAVTAYVLSPALPTSPT